jgi:hypothetical protein
LNTCIKENMLLTASVGHIGRFDTLGNLIEMSSTSIRQSRFQKDAITSNYMGIKIEGVELIQLTNNSYLFVSPFYEHFMRPKDIPNYNFTHFNSEYDSGAFDETGIFLTSVADSTNLNKPYLLLVKLTDESDPEIDETYGYRVLELPLETDLIIRRIKYVGNYFYVSTNQKTYQIDIEGNFKVIINASMSDFFEYQGIFYADNGNEIYASTDSENWNLAHENLNYERFRQFFVADNRLFFYDLDEIHEVNIGNFSHLSIPNRELKGKKITSAIEFHGKLYVTTFNGLFSKKIENLSD